jgi:hypothetical protein
MLVLTEPQKVIGMHLARQTEPSRANALSFPGHTLAFVVVVADAEMLFEVFLRVRQVVLRLGRDHRRTLYGTSANAVYHAHLWPERFESAQSVEAGFSAYGIGWPTLHGLCTFTIRDNRPRAGRTRCSEPAPFSVRRAA